MATARMAATAMLTTVSEVANTATNIISAVGTGSKMLNNFVDDAKWRQEQSIKVNKVGYVDQLKSVKTLEILQSRAVLKDYISQNPTSEADVDKIWKELEDALA